MPKDHHDSSAPSEPDIGSESETDVLDDYFQTGNIFDNKQLLNVGHVPEDQNRIVGREVEMKKVGRALGPVIENNPPRNLMVFGKTGTGKSLVTRFMCKHAKTRAETNGIRFVYTYIDCSNSNTETRSARSIALSLKEQLGVDKRIPVAGIGASEYYHYIYEMLREEDVGALIIILDEIDRLPDDNILMEFSRAEETQKTSTFIGLIAISNKIGYREELNERVDSSLQDRELTFHPYDATQIREILQNRADAFREGVLEEGVIPRAAALSAREHGDARKAIDILYEAGEVAEDNEDERVTEEHLEEGQRRTEKKRFIDIIDGSTPHVKYILAALAHLTEQSDEDWFRTVEVYDVYQDIAENEASEPVSYDRVQKLLQEQSFLGILDSDTKMGGRGKGTSAIYRLLKDEGLVQEALQEELDNGIERAHETDHSDTRLDSY